MHNIFTRYILTLFTISLLLNPTFSAAAGHMCEGHHDCMLVRASVPVSGAASGKWKDEVTPKRGWTCSSVEDRGAGNLTICEMCEREHIRFVHTMDHPGVAGLDVGCICAAYMDGYLDTAKAIEKNIEDSKKRQRLIENRAARREKFTTLSGWKLSKAGNLYIKTRDGNHIIITTHKSTRRHSASINGTFMNTWHDTINDAKLAAFDVLYPSVIRMD